LPAIAALEAHPPDALILYKVAWDPLGILRNRSIVGFLRAHYGYQPQVTSAEVTDMLRMHSIARWSERGQWIEVFESNEIRPRGLRVHLRK
jgi:hypothetical protein